MPRWYEPPGYAPSRRGDTLRRVARLYGFTVDDLRGPSRTAPVCIARHAAMRALHETGLSSGAIGLLLNRDGSTVRCALRGAE